MTTETLAERARLAAALHVRSGTLLSDAAIRDMAEFILSLDTPVPEPEPEQHWRWEDELTLADAFRAHCAAIDARPTPPVDALPLSMKVFEDEK